ncbi:MAG: hypothetical protein JWL77_1726, partial [Chthonomonadaceae bacterium]|nr:hypothetical protein [Chthonomonadaceae bacterium]
IFCLRIRELSGFFIWCLLCRRFSPEGDKKRDTKQTMDAA